MMKYKNIFRGYVYPVFKVLVRHCTQSLKILVQIHHPNLVDIFRLNST